MAKAKQKGSAKPQEKLAKLAISHPPVDLPRAWAKKDYPVEVRREIADFECELWYGSSYHPGLLGLLRLFDGAGEESGRIYLSQNPVLPRIGGDGGRTYVVVDHHPAHLSALLELLARPGGKEIVFQKINAASEPYASISFQGPE